MAFIKKIFWRLQFKKVKFTSNCFMDGHCIKCDGGNPNVECQIYTCPCSYNEQLIRKRIFYFLYTKDDIIRILDRQKKEK